MTDDSGYVVAIDGPSGSGKGSLALKIAGQLDFHLLDSGAIYRLLALKSLQLGVDLDQQQAVLEVLDDLNIRFEVGEELSAPFLDDVDVSDEELQRRRAAWQAASMQSESNDNPR